MDLRIDRIRLLLFLVMAPVSALKTKIIIRYESDSIGEACNKSLSNRELHTNSM